jgi:acetylornithine deacetylase/succinyl-diaminopimelate desuccinylase-like protein
MRDYTVDSTVDLQIQAHVEAGFPLLESDLDQWLRIPSISADPAHHPDVRRSAEWFADRCRRAGFPTVEIWETGSKDDPGLPAVFAEWPSEDAAAVTVLVYGHHDVQPVDPLDKWETPPFEPTRKGDALHARGAADDKGQVLFHLLGLTAHLATTERRSPMVNLKLLVEGEEESGSPHFAQLLEDRREALGCDLVLVSDTTMFDRETPSVCIGMRGLVGAEIQVHGADVDLHSGSFGGAVANPLHVLADILAGLHDEEGRVALPGFYDRVRPLSTDERDINERLPFDEKAFLRAAQSSATHGEPGFSTLERIGARPTAEINGIWGGYSGPGHKTIIPSDGFAKVTFRLVPDQEPEDVIGQLRDWVRSRLPEGVLASVTADGPGVRPCLTPLRHPALNAVTRAMERAFGKEILYTREGGSGPEADLASILAVPVLFLGVGLPDDRFHAPNERVLLPLLGKGAEAAAYLWEELTAVGVGPLRTVR